MGLARLGEGPALVPPWFFSLPDFTIRAVRPVYLTNWPPRKKVSPPFTNRDRLYIDRAVVPGRLDVR